MNLSLDDRHKTALIFALGMLKGLQSKYKAEMSAGLESCVLDILDQLGVTLFKRVKEPESIVEGSNETTS